MISFTVLLCIGALGYSGGFFGAGSGPIHLDYVVCAGTEYNFTDCDVRGNTRQSSHAEDVGVKCQTSKGKYSHIGMSMCSFLYINS